MKTARCLLASASLGWLLACGPASDDVRRDVAVKVGSVAVDRSGSPVVILEETRGSRSLPIWVGFAEAHSIAAEIEHQKPPRPNTHDLAKRLVDRLQGAVERVVVTDLREGTYYAVLFLIADGEVFEVDARPSDAIALALRYGAPLFVREALFEEAAHAAPPDPGEHST